MSIISSIEFEHPHGQLDTPNDAETCVHEIEFEAEREPDDPNYGADADGNRGMFVAGYFFTETDPPDKCDVCGHVYTAEERDQIQTLMNKKCDTLSSDWEPDYPEYIPDYED